METSLKQVLKLIKDNLASEKHKIQENTKLETIKTWMIRKETLLYKMFDKVTTKRYRKISKTIVVYFNIHSNTVKCTHTYTFIYLTDILGKCRREEPSLAWRQTMNQLKPYESPKSCSVYQNILKNVSKLRGKIQWFNDFNIVSCFILVCICVLLLNFYCFFCYV